jgi:hypothetical protein
MEIESPARKVHRNENVPVLVSVVSYDRYNRDGESNRNGKTAAKTGYLGVLGAILAPDDVDFDRCID